MSAEIICIGTELLLGDILNTNCHYLAQELAALGIPHYYQSVVGDNVKRIHQVISTAIARSSILIFTGGLGPTPDDLTTETIASFFDTPLEEKAAIVADIEAKFASTGRTMTPSNRKQALVPKGAETLPNPLGTAPGIIWQIPRDNQESLTIMTFPGVPSEMKRMWRDTSVPYLKNQGWGQDLIHSQMMRFRGISESALAEKVAEVFTLSNPTVAPYASLGEVRLRVSAKAKSESAAIAIIEPVAQKIKDLAGLDYFGRDSDTLSSVVGDLLRAEKRTLAIAESCTGGGLGSILTENPGSSAYFKGGVVAYDNLIKTMLLEVNPDDLDNFGAVSSAIAYQMANGVKKIFQSDYGISLTGIAGPDGGTELKPLGLIYIGLAIPGEQTIVKKFQLGSKRERSVIRKLSAYQALDLMRRYLMR